MEGRASEGYALGKTGLVMASRLPVVICMRAAASSFGGWEMNRESNTLVGLALFLVLAPSAFSQAGTPRPCPDVTAETLGCELVAWSHLQEPVPLPEPDTKPATPPDQQPGPQPGQSQSSRSRPQASRQSVTDIIVRQGAKYVLKAGDNTTYQLDDRKRAARYQDKQAKVTGRLDFATNTLHVESIELVS
jgi:hypothetical protein